MKRINISETNNVQNEMSTSKKKMIEDSNSITESITRSLDESDVYDNDFTESFDFFHVDIERTSILWIINGTKLYNYFNICYKLNMRIN